MFPEPIYATMEDRPGPVAPDPTEPARLRYQPRQVESDSSSTTDTRSTEICAYYSFDDGDNSSRWVQMQCVGGCTTSGSIFGCRDQLAKGCEECATLSRDDGCCGGDFSKCVTAVLDDRDFELTAYRCAATFSGRQTVFSDTTVVETTTEDDGDVTTFTSTDTQTEKTPISTGEDEGGARETGDSGNSDNNNSGGGDGGGSDTPVGAIVGGVIGGVALILLIAFGIWFIRFQKRKAANRQNGMEPYRQDPSAAGAGGAQQQMGYAPSSYQGSSHPASPPVAGSYMAPGSEYGGDPMQQQQQQYMHPNQPQQHNPAMYGYYGHSPKPEDLHGHHNVGHPVLSQQPQVAEMPQYGANDRSDARELP